MPLPLAHELLRRLDLSIEHLPGVGRLLSEAQLSKDELLESHLLQCLSRCYSAPGFARLCGASEKGVEVVFFIFRQGRCIVKHDAMNTGLLGVGMPSGSLGLQMCAAFLVKAAHPLVHGALRAEMPGGVPGSLVSEVSPPL